VLTTALALVALPGLAGSRAPSALEPVPVGAFQSLSVTASGATSAIAIEGLDGAHRSAGLLTAFTPFIRAGEDPTSGPTDRRDLDQPESRPESTRKPARYTLTGEATFYHNGTTAMRLPAGTVVIICGAGGCVERVVNDYGPVKPSRIVDLYVDDFFAICGCPSWSGITDVTVYVY
jgi:hypothetical protein